MASLSPPCGWRVRSATTIVMLTAADGDASQREAAAAGADLYLTNLFSPLDLFRLVDRVAGSRAEPT